MYIVVAEDIEDGIWWDEPVGYDNVEDCKDHIKKAKELPKGYEYSIYRCYRVEE